MIQRLGWPQIVFVFQTHSEEHPTTASTTKALDFGHVMLDTGSLTESLNILWSPRWYVFDSGFKLTDLQRSLGESLPAYESLGELGEGED
jgi:hypothetical protein